MPLRVISLIHWQALRLSVKRMRVYRKPPFLPGLGSVRPGSAKPESVKR
jgi:DUF1365 family protein